METKVLIFTLSLLNAAFCLNESSTSCSIQTPSGYIDLSPLGNTNLQPRFKDLIDPNQLYTYSWNPCYSFTEGSCENVAICQSLVSTDQKFILGNPGQAEFQSIPGHTGALVYTTEGEMNVLRRSTIILTCDPNVEGKLIVHGENPELQYNFELLSKYACPTEQSTLPPPAHPTAVTREPMPGPHPRPHHELP